MKKISLAVLLMTGIGFVQAGELQDGQKFWEGKEFYKAFQIFDKLAKQGDVNAQWQLGEMYGFGEGTPEDPAKAEYWLKEAQAKGSPDAAASLAALQQRQKHRADIAYYTTTFDGANVAYAKFGCVRPVIPARSTTNSEVKSVNAAIATWNECYERFIANLRNAAPIDKTIDPTILPLMNNEEFTKASVLIGKVYENILADARVIEKGISEESNSWKQATEQFAATNNQKILQMKANTQNEIDLISIEQRELLRRTQVKAVGMNR